MWVGLLANKIAEIGNTRIHISALCRWGHLQWQEGIPLVNILRLLDWFHAISLFDLILDSWCLLLTSHDVNQLHKIRGCFILLSALIYLDKVIVQGNFNVIKIRQLRLITDKRWRISRHFGLYLILEQLLAFFEQNREKFFYRLLLERSFTPYADALAVLNSNRFCDFSIARQITRFNFLFIFLNGELEVHKATYRLVAGLAQEIELFRLLFELNLFGIYCRLRGNWGLLWVWLMNSTNLSVVTN